MFSSWFDAVKNISEQGVEMLKQSGVLDTDIPVVSTDTGRVEACDAALAKEGNTVLLTRDMVLATPLTWGVSTAEWDYLVRAALLHRSSAVTDPALVSADAEKWDSVLKVLQCSEAEGEELRTAASAAPRCIPQADLISWIQAEHDVHALHSQVVPRDVSDDQFWCTLAWRCGLYKRCTSVAQLLALLRLLAAPDCATIPEVEEMDNDADEEEAEECNEVYWARVDARCAELGEEQRWVREQEGSVREEISLVEGNLQLLRSLIAKGDTTSPLAESAWESCRYHKVKFARHIGRLCEAADRLTGTSLDEHSGPLYASLLNASNAVKEALEEYEKCKLSGPDTTVMRSASAGSTSVRSKPGSPPKVELSTSHAPSLPVVHEGTGVKSNATASAVATTNASPLRSAVSTSHDEEGKKEDLSFQAKLPWDDEDD